MPQLARLDGRFVRSIRTRYAVVDALLDLLGEGDLRPTAARIAERAGVSLRIVFHHFDDLEAIYSELADRQAERVKPLTVPISISLPFARRVEEFSAQRGRLLETLSPVRRSAVLIEPFLPALAKRLKHARELTRAAAIAAFKPQLSTLTGDEKRAAIAEPDVATSRVSRGTVRGHKRLSAPWRQ